MNSLEMLDYLKNYPQEAFAPIIAIETKNTIAFQLEAKKYIEEILLRLPTEWPKVVD